MKLRFQITMHPIVEAQARQLMELRGFHGLSEFLESLVRAEHDRLGLPRIALADDPSSPVAVSPPSLRSQEVVRKSLPLGSRRDKAFNPGPLIARYEKEQRDKIKSKQLRRKAAH